MPLQSPWSRVTFYLPVNKVTEKAAVGIVIDAVRQRYKASTSSSLQPTVFLGSWWSNDINNFICDNITIVTVDVQKDHNDPSFIAELEQLLENAFNAYGTVHADQDDIWMTIHPIVRIGR